MQVDTPVISLEGVNLTVPFQKGKAELLKDINLDVFLGERVGVIGRNGAGKTVLLKVVSEIYHPSSGQVKNRGKVLSIFSVSSGGNKNWTGRQNAEIKLLMYGVAPADLPDYIEDIREFAKIGNYFDSPVKFYSAGMAARLSFAIVTSVSTDVLILDEWISVGDAAFKDSATKRFNRRVSSTGSVLFCTHSADILRAWATKVIWIEGGQIRMKGSVQDVLSAFHLSLKEDDR